MAAQDGGWVKLWRSCEDCAALSSDDAEGVWSRMLRRAAQQPTTVNWKGQSISLQPGELCFSVRAWSRERGTSYKRLRTILERFERDGMIATKQLYTDSQRVKSGALPVALRGALGVRVTICKWAAYQLFSSCEGAHEGALGAQLGRTRGAQNKKDSYSESYTDSENLSQPSLLDTQGGVGGAPNGAHNSTRKPDKPKPNTKPRGTRLPEDWTLNPEGRAWCRETLEFSERVIDETEDEFKDWGLSATGPNAVKMNWNRAFKNWARRKHERLRAEARREEQWRNRFQAPR